MSTIITRAGKGTPLTHNEVDANFTNLNTDKAETAGPTFTGAVKVAAGTAALPGLTPVGDPNTGIYSPGADQLAVATNGVERVEFGASEVVFNDGNNDYDFRVESDNNASLLFVDASTDRFGIGHSSPATLIHVADTLAGSPVIARIENFSASANSDAALDLKTPNETYTFKALRSSARLDLETGGTPKLSVNSSGQVGIGTTSPLTKLEVRSGVITAGSVDAPSGAEILRGYYSSGGAITVIGSEYSSGGPVIGYAVKPSTSASGAFLSTASGALTRGAYTIAGNIHKWYIGGSQTVTENSSVSTSEVMRIDSSGRLLVGTSTSESSFASAIQIAGAGSAGTQLISGFTANAVPGVLYLAHSRSGAVGTNTILQNNDGIGYIDFYGANGTSYDLGARIAAEVDGIPGANDMPGRLVFSTTADGASSPTERMRITSAGRFAFGGQGAPYPSATCDSYSNTSGEFIHAFRQDHVSGYGLGVGVDGTFLAYFYPNKDLLGAPVGSISQNGSATAYNTSSDYRLKENISLLPNAIVRLLELKPSRFNFISHPDRTVDGFIAHEVQAIVPEAINGEKDEVDDDGNPVYQGIDQSKLVPLLTAALQEAIAKIEILEARLTAAGIE